MTTLTTQIALTTQVGETTQTAAHPASSRHPRRTALPLRTAPASTGIAYTVSWIAGLSVGAPSPAFADSGAKIVGLLAGRHTVLVANFVLTEGLPAAGLAAIAVFAARAARAAGAATAARVALIAGSVAAAISALQCVLGVAAAGSTSPDTAHLLLTSLDRLDGVKMFLIAALAGAAVAAKVLPRWLNITGIALAVTIAASGIAFLLLIQSLAMAAYASGVLLLVFMTGTGIALGRAVK